MKHVFLVSLFFFFKSKDVFVKEITWNYIVVNDWIIIMAEMIEPNVCYIRCYGEIPTL
jgi:hypothetical protein